MSTSEVLGLSPSAETDTAFCSVGMRRSEVLLHQYSVRERMHTCKITRY